MELSKNAPVEGSGTEAPELFADVIVSVAARKLDRPFTYRVPGALAADLKAGSLVRVPFASRSLAGYVISLSRSPGELTAKILDIEEVYEGGSFWGGELLSLASWMSRYYCCRLIEAFQTILPSPIREYLSGRVRRKRPEVDKEEAGAVSLPAVAPTPARADRLLEEIRAALSGRKPEVHLLQALRADERRAVSLAAARMCLEAGREVVYLVPETGALPKDLVAIPLHSGLTSRQRFENWLRIKSGESPLVVGTRSAVFAPFRNLGLLVIEDEHDLAYKQEMTPRYHARQAAFVRARRQGAVILLASASPSVESWAAAREGKFHHHVLPSGGLPHVEVVDLKEEWRTGVRGFFGRKMVAAIKETLGAGNRVELYIARRGFSAVLLCRECGWIPRCPRCSVNLRWHKKEGQLFCHRCGHSEKAPDVCGGCASVSLSAAGAGTQKIEEEFRFLFPAVPVACLEDGGSSKLPEEAREGFEAPVLIGTPRMLLPPDLRPPGLVGVVFADTLFSLSDFRAGERTFQWLTGISARAALPGGKGHFLIQTCDPEHPAIRAVAAGRPEFFYEEELASRRELGYPPFRHLVRVILSGREEAEVERVAMALLRGLRRAHLEAKAQILGPAPCPVEKIRGNFRRHLLLRAEKAEAITPTLRSILWKLASGRVSIAVDVDPLEIV